MKGERPAEIVGFARAMRERCVRLSRDVGPVFDTCGTGGERVAVVRARSEGQLRHRVISL